MIDLHSLRMVYVTHLRLAKVTLEVAKRMARHSDARLTESIYPDFDLLGDEEKRWNFGRAGRERVEELFSEEKMCGELEHLYRRLIAAGAC